ncbi:U-scoloptoxin(19)-Sm1a-like [Nymphalis io]|uniref:U-scoloptoxin(19)-Sm1a-like n=1 Tax=Inachis io TaxID=171585 RepID=UPI0021673C81|nr:U-scoloptoxin(19)-Sm1a-like [Nymphalis io]
MLKYLICVVLSSLILDVVVSYDSEGISNLELPCLTFGGICVHTDDCPKDKQSEIKGLCPMQQKSGFECCHALPKSETRCSKHGGDCSAKNQLSCPEDLTYREATDCTDDEVCCILVN